MRMSACAFFFAVPTRVMADAANYQYGYPVPFTETSVSIKFGEIGNVDTTSDVGWYNDRVYTHAYTNVYMWPPDACAFQS